jgi:site-specific DNA-methyltransferase (adenine-specific)
MDFNEIINKLPEPYYRDWQSDIVIYNADCRDILPKIPDKSIDLVLTDPPYGVNHKSAGEPFMAGDSIKQLPLVMPLFYKLIKEEGALFIFSSTEYLREALECFQIYFRMHNIIIWDKEIPRYPHHESHFRLQYEPIIYGSRGLHYLKKERGSDIIKCHIDRGNNRVHPAQKPTDLLSELMKATQDIKNIILDPFLGSGTTLVAAKKLSRKAIGIEISEDYCKIAVERLRQGVLL